jgi:hypothetical protein
MVETNMNLKIVRSELGKFYHSRGRSQIILCHIYIVINFTYGIIPFLVMKLVRFQDFSPEES